MWQRWLLRKQLFRVVFGSLYYTDSTLYPAAQRRLGERMKRETRVCEIIISSISIHGARKDYLPAPSATIPWSHDTAALPLTPFQKLPLTTAAVTPSCTVVAGYVVWLLCFVVHYMEEDTTTHGLIYSIN